MWGNWPFGPQALLGPRGRSSQAPGKVGGRNSKPPLTQAVTTVTASLCTCGDRIAQLPGTDPPREGEKGDPYTQGVPFSSSPYLKFQEMAVLVTPLLALRVHPLRAPAQIGLISFPIPDPQKPATHTSPSGWAPKPVLALRTHILALSHEWLTVALRLPSQPGHGAGCCRLLGEGSMAWPLKVIVSLTEPSVTILSCLLPVHNSQFYSLNDG